MRFHYTFCILFICMSTLFAQKKRHMTPFEKNNNYSASYSEAISFYKDLAKAYPKRLQVNEAGATDSGFPLHEVILSVDGEFEPDALRKKGKTILFVNNAIHPGEPCGVDATMLLIRDFVLNKKKRRLLKDIVLVLIPIYNIGGALNRNSYSRANQNGPEAYGFRGNAKNLDLNRDFIKCDSRNAQSFNRLFQRWKPHVFVDNHTSNGADYPYTMTLINTHPVKLAPPLADFMQDKMLPRLYADMKAAQWQMCPYVYARSTPDEGIAAFMDLPRYSSGYAALFHCISFMPETHMLKPFADRVKSTYAFMEVLINLLNEEGETLQKAQRNATRYTQNKNSFDLNWTLDTEQHTTITFKGYKASHKKSEVTGQDRLYYDHNHPYTKQIPYYDTYRSSLSIERPMAYLIPKAYTDVIERLQWNGIVLHRLSEDFHTKVELYRIVDFKTVEAPYEGHYLHSDVQVETFQTEWLYRKGDYVVFVNQAANDYIMHTLEPQAPDSFFAWNFFDGILQQKEYFSSYVFEDLAAAYLAENPDLKKQFEEKKKADPAFAKDAHAQLAYIYRHSPHYEKTHRVYPIARFVFDVQIPLEFSSE